MFSRGWSKAKLYFMIGLPTETDEDIEGIVETGRRVRQIALEYHSRGRVDIAVSVSSHVPKPHTPFQWCAIDTIEEIERKQQLLRDLARKAKVKLKLHEPYSSWLEGVLGRGDRRVAAVIERAYHAGCRFDGWGEHLKWDAWQQAFRDSGVDPDPYLMTIPVDGRLPWDHLDVGLIDGFLSKEYKKALAGRLSPPCGKPFQAQVHHTNLEEARADQRRLVCYDCGVACDLERMREERIEFLEVLGAEHPRPSADGDGAEPPAEGRRVRAGKGKPRPERKFEQASGHRYRLKYEKVGRAVFLGHLDLVRALPRMLRRAKLDAIYSQGFHPHPQLSFGPALGLGIQSLAEYVDVVLADDLSAHALFERIARVAPEGIRFVGARRLRPSVDAAINKVVSDAVYAVVVPAGTEVSQPQPGDEITVVRKNGKERRVVVTEAVTSLRKLAAEDIADGLELPSGDAYAMTLGVGCGLRPGEAIAHLAGGVEPQAMARLALVGADGGEPLGAVPAPADAGSEADAGDGKTVFRLPVIDPSAAPLSTSEVRP